MRILDIIPAITAEIDGPNATVPGGVDSAGGGPFSDILSAEGGQKSAGTELAPQQESTAQGGNVVLQGGKDLPALLASGSGYAAGSEPEPAQIPGFGPAPAPAPESGLQPQESMLAVTSPDTATHAQESLPALVAPAIEDNGQAALVVDQEDMIAIHGRVFGLEDSLETDAMSEIAIDGFGLASASEATVAGLLPLDGFKNRPRDNILPNGQAVITREPDLASPTRTAALIDRVDMPILEEAPIGASEATLFRTSELPVPHELTGSKFSIAVQPQAVAGSIHLPIGETELSTSLKMGASSSIATPIGDPNWNNELAGRVTFIVKNGLQEGSIQLSPPELGRLEVKISTEGDQANILFTVQNIDAKEAIEQAVPRLREMLEQGGLQLARFDVADHSKSQQGERNDSATPSDQVTGDPQETPDESRQGAAAPAQISIIDFYV